MTVNTATEQAYRNGYEAGKSRTLNLLFGAFDFERPVNPTDPYDVGYNNGLTMAQAIVLKLKGDGDGNG